MRGDYLDFSLSTGVALARLRHDAAVKMPITLGSMSSREIESVDAIVREMS